MGMALLHGSPALDAGDDALLQAPYRLKKDQRGFPRKSGPHADIGAFEFQVPGSIAQGSALPPRVSATFWSGGSAQTNPASTGSDPTAAVTAPNFQLSFGDNTPGASFSVLATTNPVAPFTQWSLLGQAVQCGAGVFEFTDFQATNNPQRFYRVTSP